MRIIYGLILPIVFSIVSFFSSVSVVAQDKNLNKPGPKVMVVIYSTEVSSSFLGVAMEGNRNTENQIENCLISEGFQLVDAGQISRKKELESLLMKEDASLAGKIAMDFGADILVQGDVRRTFVDVRKIFGTPTRFFSNEIRIKVFRTDTGKILFSGYRTRPPSGAGALLPLEDAANELCQEMTDKMLPVIKGDALKAETYELNISGVSFNSLSKFKKKLRNISGLSEMHVRSFQSGHALMEVKYDGVIEDLADKINRMGNPYLQIIGLQSGSLDIRFTEK
ncbi:MAG: hypothetical protein JRE28_11330 [Deltaproteobacteria bacterium]|nr:hypothetical protein [Deltaproteobacteria bacterium]